MSIQTTYNVAIKDESHFLGYRLTNYSYDTLEHAEQVRTLLNANNLYQFCIVSTSTDTWGNEE
ncbi:hypothetical protein EJP75_13955 [Acinetobacter baumannii]|nr:hypothetical protein EJP75_13955 [Acinetobacter baumannii]